MLAFASDLSINSIHWKFNFINCSRYLIIANYLITLDLVSLSKEIFQLSECSDYVFSLLLSCFLYSVNLNSVIYLPNLEH
jgi:hypothetical protein